MLVIRFALVAVLMFLLVVSLSMWVFRATAKRHDAAGRARIRHREYLVDAALGLLYAVWLVPYIIDAPTALRAWGYSAVALLFVGLACWNLRKRAMAEGGNTDA
jgi:hypothetical protein